MENFLKSISKRVLIVDDEQGQIDELSNKFISDFGITPKTHLYDQFNCPQVKFSDIKIVFFDLHLTPQGFNLNSEEIKDWRDDSNTRAVFNNLAIAIKDIIDLGCYPYILIFWTTHHEFVSHFKDFMKERKDHYSDFPTPLSIDYLSKDDFHASTNKKQLLEEKLKNTYFYEISRFQQLIIDETQILMKELSEVANEDEKLVWENEISPMSQFLRSLAVKNAGKKVALAHPTKSLVEALLPILNYRIVKQSEIKDIWKDFLNLNPNTPRKDYQFSERTSRAKLNNILHIDDKPNHVTDRGVVFILKKDKKEAENFFSNSNDLKSKKHVINSTLVDFPRESRDSVDIFIMEISSACDYSQDKNRVKKYVVGLKIPSECYASYLEFLKTTGKKLSQSTFTIDTEFLDYNNNGKFYIALNLNFICILKKGDELFFEHIFTFKKEMMDYIGNRYANHVSRIGITSF